jgi:hypothetical protein
MLRRISAHKGEEVTGLCEKLYDYELRNLYFSPYLIRVTRSQRWAGRIAHIIAVRMLVEKPAEKILLGISRRRWENIIKMDLKIGYEGVKWIQLAQDRID